MSFTGHACLKDSEGIFQEAYSFAHFRDLSMELIGICKNEPKSDFVLKVRKECLGTRCRNRPGSLTGGEASCSEWTMIE